jgi:adenine-specific DNA-methyltransferase
VPQPRQLTLLEEHMSLAELAPDPGADYGEVFTRRWVVDLILDLVGYTPDNDLAAQVLVEPSCGTGAFLVPVVERLIASSAKHGRNLRTLGAAVRAFDLLEANAERARKSVAELLTGQGLTDEEAETLTAEWITTGDFLLYPHEAGSADYVVGNPPYIRLENISRRTMDAYRRICPTMRGRADIYVGFFERGLDLLKPGGALSFICADRWMRNQYGADLRELITADYAVETVISMHDVEAFEDDVSAYPAIVVLRNEPQRKAVVVEANVRFGEADAPRLSRWARRGHRNRVATASYEATRVEGWFSGRDLWPAGSPSQLALIADLEARFPPLQDAARSTRVGIGVATGCDDVFITADPDLVEDDRLLPLLQAPDTTSGSVDWSGRYLVNPWNGSGLVDLDRYPRLAEYLHDNGHRLRARHIAKQRPATWYRTIDRVDHDLTDRPKLVLPDMKATAHPVLDEGGFYPHHNLYYVVSDVWDPEVLGGILLSDIANLFVGAYCVRMRGGTYRFQAQYLRRIRVPDPQSISRPVAQGLARAFRARDRERASGIAASLFGLSRDDLAV